MQYYQRLVLRSPRTRRNAAGESGGGPAGVSRRDRRSHSTIGSGRFAGASSKRARRSADESKLSAASILTIGRRPEFLRGVRANTSPRSGGCGAGPFLERQPVLRLRPAKPLKAAVDYRLTN